MRALKKTDSAFIDGQRVYYNHIRRHSALDGKTPAEAAGLHLNLKGNKWLEFIERDQNLMTDQVFVIFRITV